MEPGRPVGGLRRERVADHGPAAVRHGSAVSVSGRPVGGAGLQASRDVQQQHAAGVLREQPPSLRTVQHAKQLAPTGADDLRQSRLAQGWHTGAGQNRTGQAQNVRVPQDPVPARVEAQDIPDRYFLQVPVDLQADEAVQVTHDTARPDNATADIHVAVLGTDARWRDPVHPQAHN